MTRSYLFVPADSEKKLLKAADTEADALIVDLEDAVAAEARTAARRQAAEFLRDRADAWVRINPIDTRDAALDLEAVIPARPAGILLPKSAGGADVAKLAERLDDLEQRHGLGAGKTRIMALCTERPRSLLNLDSYVGATPRLSALTWGAEDLGAAVGVRRRRDEAGNWLPLFEMARSLCLLTAAAAGVMAVDTVYTDFRDAEGLLRYAANAYRDGFTGMLAIHPAQVGPINDAFTPSADELARAQRIVDLFAEHPGAGTIGMDGEMIDRPHLLQAERVLRMTKK